MNENVKSIKQESVTERAKREVDEEYTDKAVKTLKDKLRERKDAQAVVDNIDREIEDLEDQIEQGNL